MRGARAASMRAKPAQWDVRAVRIRHEGLEHGLSGRPALAHLSEQDPVVSVAGQGRLMLTQIRWEPSIFGEALTRLGVAARHRRTSHRSEQDAPLFTDAESAKAVPTGPLPPGDLHVGRVSVLRRHHVGPNAIGSTHVGAIRDNAAARIAFLSSGMASIGGKHDEIEYSYSAGKATLNMVLRVLSLELQSRDIRVVALNPGWVATTLVRRLG